MQRSSTLQKIDWVISHFSFKSFQCGGFKFAIKLLINLLFRICYLTYCHVAENQFVLNGCMKILTLTFLIFFKLLRLLKITGEVASALSSDIYLCCYLHSRRKTRRILRIFKFARISWILQESEELCTLFYAGVLWTVCFINS